MSHDHVRPGRGGHRGFDVLTKLTSRGFQRFKNLTVRLDRVTSIVGPSDAGKSTIVRALKWVALNRWKPAYLRHGSPAAEVVLIADGKRVARRKGKGKNVYKVGNHVYSAVGKTIPPAVQTLLNLDESNFQMQLDAHYWFGDNKATVSKKLNEIVNLTAIDRAVDKAGKEVKRATAEYDVCRGRIKDALGTIKELDWVPGVGREFRKLERLAETASESHQNAVRMAELVESHSTLTRARIAADGAADSGEKAVAAGRRAERFRRRIAELNDLINVLEMSESVKPVPNIGPLLAERKAADAVAESRRELEFGIQDWKNLEEDLCKTRTRREAVERKVRKAGRCPVCGQKVRIR